MYTHLLIERDSAEQLYPFVTERAAVVGTQKVRDAGVVVGTTLMDHFDQYSQAYVGYLDCTMHFERHDRLFSLRYRYYLPEVPQQLVDMGIKIVGAEIVRFNSAPTKARAGFYAWPQRNATATVERVFPTQQNTSGRRFSLKSVPTYAQNIHVKAMSLTDAKQFNSKLSQGHFNRFLVDAWE